MLIVVHPVRAQTGTESGVQPVTVHLSSQGPCEDTHSLTRSVEQTMGRKVFKERDTDVNLRRNVVRSAHGYHVELQLSDAEGQSLGVRRLNADSCEQLIETEALVLSLMLDFRRDEIAERAEQAEQELALSTGTASPGGTAPVATEAPPESENPPEPPKDEPEQPETTPPPPQEPPKEIPVVSELPRVRRRPQRYSFEIAALGLVATGYAPEPSFGFGLQLGGFGRYWGGAVRGALWTAQQFTAQDVRVSFSGAQLAPLVCGILPLTKSIQTRVCGVLRLSWVSAEADELSNGGLVKGLHVGAGPELEVGWTPKGLSRLRLGAGVGVVFGIRPYELVIQDQAQEQSLYVSAPVSLQGLLSASWQLW